MGPSLRATLRGVERRREPGDLLTPDRLPDEALDRGQMGAMAGYGGMEEFGVPNQGGEVDDDLARFIY